MVAGSRRIAVALLTCLTSMTCLGALAPARATAEAPSGVQDTPAADRVFAEDSFWYRPLPDDTPVAADSRRVVDAIVDQAESHYGAPGRPHLAVNTTEYSPPLYEADPSDPAASIGYENCQGKAGDDLYVAELFTADDAPMRDVRIPAGARPAGGTDAEMVVVDRAADRVVETWKTRANPDGSYSACWGGVIEDASSDDGVFDAPFGVAASGLSLLGGTIAADELAGGRIDHVVGLALPYSLPAPAFSRPATRSDGVNPQGVPVAAQGQLLRLPADLDLDSLDLSPAARAVARAAQEYGLVVWDTAGAVSLRAEGTASAGTDVYAEVFRGRSGAEEMAGDPERDEDPFPLDRLELLPVDYEAPLPSAAPDAPDAQGRGTEPAVEQRAEGTARELPGAGWLLAGGLGVLALAAFTLAGRAGGRAPGRSGARRRP